MIDELTKAQQDTFPHYVEKWVERGLSTTPTDRTQAEKDMVRVYEVAGAKPPGRFLWFDNPYAGLLAASLLENEGVDDTQIKSHMTIEQLKQMHEDNKLEVKQAYCGFGLQDASWLGFYDFFHTECKLQECEKIRPLMALSKNCGWWWGFEELAILTDKPTFLAKDESGALDNSDGAALMYGKSDWGLFVVHGVRVSRSIIEHPELITIEDIDTEENAEIRRIKLDRYGRERFIKDSNAEMIAADDFGKLYKREIPGDEPLVMVEVVNATPEKHDGSFKKYFLRCHPETKTARAAVAASFQRTEEEYDPEIET